MRGDQRLSTSTKRVQNWSFGLVDLRQLFSQITAQSTSQPEYLGINDARSIYLKPNIWKPPYTKFVRVIE